jgi:hypothetical protein
MAPHHHHFIDYVSVFCQKGLSWDSPQSVKKRKGKSVSVMGSGGL